jgi:hypothetical protein
MEEKNKDAKNAEDLTPGQTDPTGDKKDNQNSDDNQKDDKEKEITISEKELETLKKKAADFEASIELKRLAKLEKKEEPKDDNEIVAKVQKLEQELSSFKAQSFNSNLSEAYREFVAENPWANDDAKFDKIKDAFVSVGTETKDELFSKLKSAAQVSFPTEYEKHLENKIKSKLLSEKISIPDGGSAAPANILHKDEKSKTEEDLRRERLGSLLRKNMTWIKQ